MPVLVNPRYERFAQEIFNGKLSQVEAFAAAGFKPNESHACRLAARSEVKARVAELLAASAEKAEITQAMVLAELAKIGFSDIRKLFGPGGQLKRVEDLDDDSAACLSSIEVVTKKVPGSDDNEVEHVAKLKLWDKRAALVDIGKHLGMFKEVVEHTGKDGGPIEIGDSDLARLTVFLLSKEAKKG